MAAGEMAEADTAVSDSDDDEEEGDVKIVLHQPEEWDEDETGEEMGEDDYTEQDAEELLEGGEEGMGDGANGAAGTSTDEAASTLAVRAGAAKSASAKVTPAKKSKSDAGGSATTAKGVKAAKAETAKALAALKARLGPVAHMPGGLLVDLDMAPENLDLDSIQDPGWKRPDADPTDYFNYGFNEETWRFYCQRQKVCGHGLCLCTWPHACGSQAGPSSLTWSAALLAVRRRFELRCNPSPRLPPHRTPLAWAGRWEHRLPDQWLRCIWELRRAWAASWASH